MFSLTATIAARRRQRRKHRRFVESPAQFDEATKLAHVVSATAAYLAWPQAKR